MLPFWERWKRGKTKRDTNKPMEGLSFSLPQWPQTNSGIQINVKKRNYMKENG
jgi:hypothetical protein